MWADSFLHELFTEGSSSSAGASVETGGTQVLATAKACSCSQTTAADTIKELEECISQHLPGPAIGAIKEPEECISQPLPGQVIGTNKELAECIEHPLPGSVAVGTIKDDYLGLISMGF